MARKIVRLKLKEKVLADFEITKNKSTTAKNFSQFNISRQQIQQWVKNKDKIKKSKYKLNSFRINSNKKKGKFGNMESKLDEWIIENRERGGVISGFTIKVKAIEFWRQTDQVVDFKASDGWLRRFLNRFNYTRRRLTTSGRELPANSLDVIKKWIDDLQNVLHNVDRAQIINMDETSIYLDAPSNYTYTKKGSRRVKVTTSGNERTRMSAAYSAAANGAKLPIFIIVSRKTDLPNFESPENCN
jgi:hypothetical protein